MHRDTGGYQFLIAVKVCIEDWIIAVRVTDELSIFLPEGGGENSPG
jgi:hypothetical protein